MVKLSKRTRMSPLGLSSMATNSSIAWAISKAVIAFFGIRSSRVSPFALFGTSRRAASALISEVASCTRSTMKGLRNRRRQRERMQDFPTAMERQRCRPTGSDDGGVPEVPRPSFIVFDEEREPVDCQRNRRVAIERGKKRDDDVVEP